MTGPSPDLGRTPRRFTPAQLRALRKVAEGAVDHYEPWRGTGDSYHGIRRDVAERLLDAGAIIFRRREAGNISHFRKLDLTDLGRAVLGGSNDNE